MALKPCLRFCRGLIYAQWCVAAADSRNTRRGPASNCRRLRGPPAASLLSIHQRRRINLRIRERLSCSSRAADSGISFRHAVVFVPATPGSTFEPPLENPANAFPAVCLPPSASTFQMFTCRAFLTTVCCSRCFWLFARAT